MSSDFKKFWIGQTISNLGSSFTQWAVPLLVYQLTHSALSLGVATAATFVPYLLFGLLIGAWMDRVDRKKAMIVLDSVNAIVILSIPLVAQFGHLTVGWIYVVTFIQSTIFIAFSAGEFAAIPSLVSTDDLVTANGRIQATYLGSAGRGAAPRRRAPLGHAVDVGDVVRLRVVRRLRPVTCARSRELQRTDRRGEGADEDPARRP